MLFTTDTLLPDLYYVGIDIMGQSLRTINQLARFDPVEYPPYPTNAPDFLYSFAEVMMSQVRVIRHLLLDTTAFPLNVTITFWVRRKFMEGGGLVPGFDTPRKFTIPTPFTSDGTRIQEIRVVYQEGQIDLRTS
jgi:hypothetical protein